PALVASGALRSPFSWMWKPCAPGASPVSEAATATSSPRCVNSTTPFALCPCVGCIAACARAPASDESLQGMYEQPATRAQLATTNTPADLMGSPWTRGKPAVCQPGARGLDDQRAT